MNWWPAVVQLGVSLFIVAAILLNPMLDADTPDSAEVLGAQVITEQTAAQQQGDSSSQTAADEETQRAAQPTATPEPVSATVIDETLVLFGTCDDQVDDVSLQGEPGNRPGTDLVRVSAELTADKLEFVFQLSASATSASSGPTDLALWSAHIYSTSGDLVVSASIEGTEQAGKSLLLTSLTDETGKPRSAQPGAAVDGSELTIWIDRSELGNLAPPLSFTAQSQSGAFAKFSDQCNNAGLPVQLQQTS